MDVLSPLGHLNTFREMVNATLEETLPVVGNPPHRIHAAMRHAVLSPGKRLRPLLTLVTAHHLGCSPRAALPAACALEFVHAASLVFDDLPCMDDAAMRRGQPSVHVRHGEDVAILTGVALLNEAYSLVSCAPDLPAAARCEMTKLLARTVGPAGMIGGQDKDLVGVADLSADDARRMHHEKTGVLFVAAVEMGVLAAGADEAARRALCSFAHELGLAFQAMDDLADQEDLLRVKPTSNLIAVMGRDGVQQESCRRLARAKAALCAGPAPLDAMGDYVDLLIGMIAA